jgi:hypothetical protein
MASILNNKRQVPCVHSEETLEENGVRSEGLQKKLRTLLEETSM